METTHVATVNRTICAVRLTTLNPIQLMSVIRRQVLANGESDDKQRHEFGNDHRGEDLNAYGVPQASLVDQHLRNHPEAGVVSQDVV